MKNKKITIYISLIIAIFLLNTAKASGQIYDGGEWGGSSSGDESSCNTGCGGGNHGYAACNWDSNSHTVDAGLLISILDYNAESNTYTTVVSKYLKTNSGAWGAKTLKTIKQCTTTENRSHFAADTTGRDNISGCNENSESVEDIQRTTITITYSAPDITKSPTLKDADGELVASIPSGIPAFSKGTLRNYVQNKLLNSLFPATSYQERIRSINRTMGLNGTNKALSEKEYNRYYVKIEPIYRLYPAPKSVASSSNTTSSGITVSTNYAECGDKYSYTTSSTSCADKDSSGKCPDGYYEETCNKKACKKVTTTQHPNEGTCKIKWILSEQTIEYGTKYDEQGNASTTSFGNNLYTARDGGNLTYLKALYMEESNNSHPALGNQAQILSGKKDYYVGYTYQNAIAMGPSGYHKFSSSNNIYKLVKNLSDVTNDPTKTVGMAIYTVMPPNEIPSCTNACLKYDSNKANDSYLKCASNYCDSHVEIKEGESATVAKRHCLLDQDQCDYHPAKPIDCNNNNLDYSTKVSQINGGSLDGTTATSYCGFTDNTKKKSATSKEGAYYFCERQGIDTKENRTDGKDVYTYQDASSYLNVACMEKASYGFTDLSNTTLRPGEAIENYQVNLTATRNCQVFFDTISWKLDFASTHANDKYRKSLLLNKIKGFNLLETSTDEKNTINGSEILGKVVKDTDNVKTMTLNDVEKDGNSIVKINQLTIKNDDPKTKVTAVVEEVVDKAKSTVGMKPYGGEITLEKVNNEGKGYISKNFITNSNVDSVTKVLDYDESKQKNKYDIGYQSVNRYVYSSGIDNDYRLPRVCVKDDGSGQVELKEGEGNCKSTTNQPDYLPKRNYYTSKIATLNREIKKANLNLKHQFITTAIINKNKFGETIENTNYFVDDENCDYGIDKSKVEPGISYKKDGTAGTGCLGVEHDNVEAQLYRKNVDLEEGVTIKNKGIQEITGSTFGTSVPNGLEKVTLNVKEISISEVGSEVVVTNERRTVEAVLEDSKGNRYYEQSSIDILPSPNGACSISLQLNTTYRVKSNTSVIYVASTKIRNADGSLKWQRVTGKDNEFIFNSFSQEEMIYVGQNSNGKLVICAEYNNGAKCTDCNTTVPDKKDLNKISNYCDNHWKTDIGKPNDPDDCVNSCKCECPVDCEITTVTSWCIANYSKNGCYKDPDDCISECSCVPKDKYVYRPINEYNPFPYSESSSTYGYTTGDRLIGKNWIKKEHLITDDADSNYTKNPLFEVELSISDLAAIRSDTKSYFDREIDPYYSRKTYSKAGSCLLPDKNGYIYKGYCSKLIHEGSIANKFTKVRGL